MEEQIITESKFSETADKKRKYFFGHILPFAFWLVGILFLQICETVGWCPRPFYPWSYAIKTLFCAGIFIYYRPWELYPKFTWQDLIWAVGAGLLVTILWILPETQWVHQKVPLFQDFYYRWLVMMPGSLPDYVDAEAFPLPPVGHISWSYSPMEAGWGLTIMKLIGSAFVIAIIEEFFFRGFLYRWIRKNSFWTLALRHFDLYSFVIVTAVFGLEHDRWLAGAIAGMVYGFVAIRTGRIWPAAIAHVLTNLLLGIWVIVTQQYGFW